MWLSERKGTIVVAKDFFFVPQARRGVLTNGQLALAAVRVQATKKALGII